MNPKESLLTPEQIKDFELEGLRAQVKEQEETIKHMRDTYWTLSRRLKQFAKDFCLDEGYAGVTRWIIHESNHEWMSSSKRSDPSDSEIPF